MNYSIVFAVIAAMGAGWSYYRFFRGTGLLAGILLELVVGLAVLQFEKAGVYMAIVMLAAAVAMELRHRQARQPFLSGEMAYEGGGIRRGLNPIQVAVLLKQPDREVLQLGILEALTAGKIKLLPGEEIKFALADHLAVEELNPRDRREGRQRAGLEAFQVISAVDDVLLELIRQHQGQAIGSLQPDIWLAQLSDNTDFAISGFDREQTVEYYDAFMSHRLMGVSGGHFEAEEYLGWLVLAGQTGVLSQAAVDVVAEQINPDWLPDEISLSAWLEKLKAAI